MLTRPLRQAAGFYAIAFGLSTAFALVAPRLGEGVLFLTMFAPLVATVLSRSLSPEGHRFRVSELALSRLGLWHWPFALIAPAAALLPGYLVVWAIGIGRPVLPSDWDLLRLAASLILGLVTGITLGALGEEVGWRGYLLPRLVPAMGVGRAGLLSGFLHGAWHLPLILLTPFYHADGQPWIVIPLFTVLLTLSGPVFARLRLSSGSIVPVAVMHSAWNEYWNLLSTLTQGKNRVWIAYLSGEGGAVSILAMLVLLAWLARPDRGRRCRRGLPAPV